VEVVALDVVPPQSHSPKTLPSSAQRCAPRPPPGHAHSTTEPGWQVWLLGSGSVPPHAAARRKAQRRERADRIVRS
jgi:hypothetical protein